MDKGGDKCGASGGALWITCGYVDKSNYETIFKKRSNSSNSDFISSTRCCCGCFFSVNGDISWGVFAGTDGPDTGGGFGREFQSNAQRIISEESFSLNMNKREVATSLLEKFLGIPYRWGGDDAMEGFDCSGLMVEVLKSTGEMSREKDYTAQGLSKLYPETEVLQAGVLVFYDWNNDGKIDHVEMVALVDDDGEVYTVGASGGGSATTSLRAASSSNAYVKMRPLRPGHVVAVDPY